MLRAWCWGNGRSNTQTWHRRCPRDEVIESKLDQLCVAVRREVEGETVVYLTEKAIAELADAIEKSSHAKFADEVGKDVAGIPAGARVLVEVDEKLPILEGRRLVGELIRSMQEGDPLRVKMRPMGTSREPPLDSFARELMKEPLRRTRALAGKRSLEEMRDRPLLRIRPALIQTSYFRLCAPSGQLCL